LLPHIPACLEALKSLRQGEVVRVGAPHHESSR
jgi:hypothetical protein